MLVSVLPVVFAVSVGVGVRNSGSNVAVIACGVGCCTYDVGGIPGVAGRDRDA